MKAATIIFAVCAVLFSIFMSATISITCDTDNHTNHLPGLSPPIHSHRSSSKAAASLPASHPSPAPSSHAHTTRTPPRRTSVTTLPVRQPSSAATLPARQLQLWSSAQSICSSVDIVDATFALTPCEQPHWSDTRSSPGQLSHDTIKRCFMLKEGFSLSPLMDLYGWMALFTT